MDTLHTCVALGPLAAYFLVLAFVNLVPRPVVLSGASDTIFLGCGISGFIISGPMQLFWPEAAAANFGPWVWLMLLVLYALALTLMVLLMRPRLVVYNSGAAQVREVLSRVARELDPNAQWAGESLHLPNLQVQLHWEPFPPLRNVQLVSTGGLQSLMGWRQLHRALGTALRAVKTTPNPYGVCLLLSAGAMWALIGFWLYSQGPQLAAGLRLMLRWEG